MIVVRLIGGLGNQMFQYAVARSLADRHKAVLKLDVSGYEHNTLRRYELGDFNIRAEIADKQDLDFFKVNRAQHPLLRRIQERIPFFAPKMVFREASFVYDDQIVAVKPPVYLDGYWQTERYFVQNSEVIQRDFILRKQLDERNKEMLAQIERQNAISLHVRRGDYVNDPHTNNVHGTCSLEYYYSALRYIKERVKSPHLFIFSDDHVWTRRMLNFDCPVTYVTLNSKDNGAFDMVLMQNCRHHIIANSSFSWWGAWLNPFPGKIVVAPGTWFKMALHETSDLIPSAWIRL